MSYPPCGGVKGHPPSPPELQRALSAMKRLVPARKLDGAEKGKTLLVLGNSSSLDETKLDDLKGVPVVGCNRGLLRWKISLDYWVVADREPYCQMRDRGLLRDFIARGGKAIGSHSLFDPRSLLRPPYSNPDRRAQPVPDEPFHVYNIRVQRTNPVMELKTFGHPIESGLNIACSMVQTAAILGAARVVFAGIELQWPRGKPSHFYGDGKRWGAYSQNKETVAYVCRCMALAREGYKKLGIQWENRSPVTTSPFAAVWGRHG